MNAKIRRRQLDKALEPYKEIPQLKRGYIREIREALEMSNRVLASRLSITPSALSQLERSEVSGGISLKSLERVAEAIDCRLVYALVPNKELTLQVNERAKDLALKLLAKTNATMALEQQEISDSELKALAAELTQEILVKGDHRIWDDNVV